MKSSPHAEHLALRRGLLAVMRLSHEPMVLTDPHDADNPIIAANAAFARLSGYSEPECLGRNCRFLQGPRTDRAATRQLGQTLRQGQGIVQLVGNYRRDGTFFWNLLFVLPVRDREGRLHFFFANQHDLTGGPPLNLAELPLGPAELSPGQETEFRLLLLDIVQEVDAASLSDTLAERVRALEGAVERAREVARLATGLQPGPER